MSPAQVILLGPQNGSADLGAVLREQGVSGRVALVTAGWQEREADDAALVAALGLPVVNLRLHARADEVFAADPPLTAAWKARQELLRHLQDFYRVRLDYIDDAARAISVRLVEPELLEQEWQVSVDLFRQLDRDHLERCVAIHAGFEARWRLGERPVIARHRSELGALVAGSDAVVVAGGHVASLLNRMKLFDLIGLAAGKLLVAWSAGAMVLTDRIVLFHDHPPFGKAIAQVLEAGFALAPDVVVLPDPDRRIRLDDRLGIARFAQRMAPATCVAMGRGARIVFERGRPMRASAIRLLPTGEVEHGWVG
ncbi:MAG TPA: hypothetical protein VFU21_16015 [Kofleriaceae bacterium]|nr:hypothetical protein [Kofleriaceae bacterium]